MSAYKMESVTGKIYPCVNFNFYGNKKLENARKKRYIKNIFMT